MNRLYFIVLVLALASLLASCAEDPVVDLSAKEILGASDSDPMVTIRFNPCAIKADVEVFVGDQFAKRFQNLTWAKIQLPAWVDTITVRVIPQDSSTPPRYYGLRLDFSKGKRDDTGVPMADGLVIPCPP